MDRIRSFLNSILERSYILFLDEGDRLAQYSYWRGSLNFMVSCSLLMILIVGSLGLITTWEWALAVALLFLITLAYVKRKRFLSPSSIWIQSNLQRLVQWGERVRSRDNWNVFKRSVEKYHLSLAFIASVSALIGMPLSNGVYQMLSLDMGLGSEISWTLWIVHATATGFSFVVLIFFWEYLGDEYDSNSHIRIAVRYTWSLHIVYFLLAANVLIGIAALLAQGSPATPLVFVQTVLYLFSIVGIYWIYRTVYRMMTQDMLGGKIFSELRHSMRRNLMESEEALWTRVLEQQIGREFPRYALSQFLGSQRRFTAQEVGIQGRVTDIHLERIHDLFDEAANYGFSIETLPELGDNYEGSDEVFVVDGSPNQNQSKSLKEGLNRAVKVI